MILNGSQRGGGQNLATHLLKDENEHIDLYALRGFLSNDLHGAFKEAYAVSKGTKCTQYLYSLSLNPPQNAEVSTKDFEAAIERVEDKLGLTDQPRAIVFHEKQGRRHCHVVWSRIDPVTMTAKQLSYTHYKLRDISRALFLEYGWELPKGLLNSKERDPKNFTLAEWQQAKRALKDPREIKAAIQDIWSISDNKTAFAHALKDRGYWLARGDRRGFVAVDLKGEVYSIAKATGVKTRDINKKLGGKDALATLPSVAEAKAHIVADLSPTLKRLMEDQERKRLHKAVTHADRVAKIGEDQSLERNTLDDALEHRWLQEATARQSRFKSGIAGLWDRVTGKHKKIQEQNDHEALTALDRDRQQKDALIQQHLQDRRKEQQRFEKSVAPLSKDMLTLREDAAYLDQLKVEADKRTLSYLFRQQQELERERHRRHSRDGPSFEL